MNQHKIHYQNDYMSTHNTSTLMSKPEWSKTEAGQIELSAIHSLTYFLDKIKVYDIDGSLIFTEHNSHIGQIFEDIKLCLNLSQSLHSNRYIFLDNGGFIQKSNISEVQRVEYPYESVLQLVNHAGEILYALSSYEYANIDQLYAELNNALNSHSNIIDWKLYEPDNSFYPDLTQGLGI